jgi:hypothetical protein
MLAELTDLRAQRDELLVLAEAVFAMRHDIEIFYAKYREPGNLYKVHLDAALKAVHKSLEWVCDNCGDKPPCADREKLIGMGCTCGGTYRKVAHSTPNQSQ